MKLFLCRGCGRHVKDCAASCPFCGAVVATEACVDDRHTAPRVSRGTLLAGIGATVVAVASCASYGQCPISVEVSSPCGFTLIETTCSGGLPTCNGNSSCEVGPVTDNCAIAVKLGDGTEHTIAVTKDRCVAPSFVDFTSPTCK